MNKLTSLHSTLSVKTLNTTDAKALSIQFSFQFFKYRSGDDKFSDLKELIIWIGIGLGAALPVQIQMQPILQQLF
ncbi:hypothetical protein ACMXYX_17780 (plasmid) [Neptuniibacter sp. QD72_48]|uniref:hypothetical protein n=1 Tax=Neptuniibacter sp. QD72_48 TaxID=3398214 RepID=UPI0039F55906